VKDQRKFTDVVEQIKSSEEDVDKVLTAARLNRHEGPPRYLSAQQKMDLLGGLMLLVGVGMMVLLLLSPCLFG